MSDAHPTWDELVAAAEAGQTTSISAHLAGCADCSALLSDAQKLLEAMGTRLEAVPPAIAMRGLTAIRHELAARESVRSPMSILQDWVQRVGNAVDVVLATPIGMEPVPSQALRGVSRATPHMMMFDSAAHTVTVSLVREHGRSTLDVRGQIVPKGAGELPTGGRVGLRVDDTIHETTVGDLGDFTFDDVPDGTLQIEVGLGSSLIRLTPITRHSDEER